MSADLGKPTRSAVSSPEQIGPSTDVSGPHRSAASSPNHVARPIDQDAAVQALKYGPRGALVIAGIGVALLFIGWLAFYFLLFLPRGSVG